MKHSFQSIENKDREILKANELTVNTLNEKVRYQEGRIDNLTFVRNDLQEKLRQLQETGEKMQEHVGSLGREVEKTRRQARARYNEDKALLKKKLDDANSENMTLQQDMLEALDRATRSQRKTKTCLDDCFVQLVVSESKKSDLAERLAKQCGLYEEERKKRTELEQQILPILGNLQGGIGDGAQRLFAKLEDIQRTMQAINADEERNACLQQCLDEIKSLRDFPVLAPQDVKKAEGMLRFVHER